MPALPYCYEYPHPAVTVDIVVFTVREGRLKVLLVRRGLAPYAGQWALPGGFVQMHEDLDEAARRELAEETGVRDVYLEQLYTFGAPGRDPRERVITVAHYALIASERLRLQADTDAEAVGWFGVDELPPLAFDHADIIALAHRRLVSKLDYSTIAFQFLPPAFTLAQLQEIYEIIMREQLDKRNFRKWALALEQVEETGDTTAGPHRPAKLYRLKNPGTVDFTR
jgi:8-oxo-dGTP diphosphatase